MAFRSFLALLTLSATRAAPLGLLGGSSDDDNTPSPSSSARCPDGGTWQTYSSSFSSFDSSQWTIESGASGVKFGKGGATLTLSEDMAPTGGIVIVSNHSWLAPVTMSVELKTSGDGGIVNPFIFKGDGSTGDEIDLEVVGETFQLPLWKRGQRLNKDQPSDWDVRQRLRHGTKEQSEYAYSYPGYNPKEFTSYEIDWESEMILWTVDGNERVALEKKSGNVPTGPLPIRFGIWSTDADQDWAGKVDWHKNPHPVVQARRFIIEGCRAD